MPFVYTNLSRVYDCGMVTHNPLALTGGAPLIQVPFLPYSTIDDTDALEVQRVIRSGILSKFVGDAGDHFLGGEEVRGFEENFSKKFRVDHSVSVNSWTSGLWVALGALELDPGSEVITSPWTMAATATTLLHWNVVPVFADIDKRTFNLDPAEVESKVTSRTRAIVCPDIFGQSADIESLLKICTKYDLSLVSDTAQAPFASRNGYFAGTASHIGGFSFNYHKHIHTGEGGMIVTNNADLASRMQLLRNHGEVVISRMPKEQHQYGILGMNMRLGEIEGAIGKNQLLKLDDAVASRQRAAARFELGLKDLIGLETPYVEPENTHVYYVFGMNLNLEEIGATRAQVVDALRAEGVPGLMVGYQNLHKFPLFVDQLTYRSNPLPYSLLPSKRATELKNQNLPIAETFHNETFFGINWCAFAYSDEEVDLLIEAFHKVWTNLKYLKDV
jgi:perosamine synthetase